MGTYRRHLSLIAVAILLLPHISMAAREECVVCHPAHFARERCVSCHRGNDRTRHLQVAHHGIIPGRYAWWAIPRSPQVERGKKLIAQVGCLRCHTMERKGNGLAAALDQVAVENSPLEIAKAISCPALYMPNFRLGEDDTTALVNAILAAARPALKSAPEKPTVVHFQREDGGNVFERRCGACHRALTRRLGGVGRGELGPDLSGVMSEYYPGKIGKERWTNNLLRKWLANPRRYRKNSPMPPIPLSGAEFAELTGALSSPAPPCKGGAGG